MSTGDILLVVISGLGVVHGLFLAIFLWSYSKGNAKANKILSLLLLVLSFRVGKSVFLEFMEQLDVKMIFIGLGTLMAIGPLFYFFVLSCIRKDFQFHKQYLIHFIPTVLGISLGFWLNESHLETLSMFLFLGLFLGYYLHYLIYILIGYVHITRGRVGGLNEDTYQFLRLMFFGLIIIWVAYVLNLFDEDVPYIVGPVLYSIVAYVISFIVIKRGYIMKVDEAKYKTTPVSDEQITSLFNKVEKIVFEEQGYRSPDLTLKSLSQLLKVSTQVLSMVINQQHKGNFNSYINQYRIEESIKLFGNEQYLNHTIAAIAFEVGFNNISSFNTTFKKQTGKTPLAYRQNLMK